MSVVRFTDKWLSSSALRPSDGRAEYTDGLCPGLQLRVTSRGVRTFSVVFRLDGRLTRRTVGRYPLVSLADARNAALDVLRRAQDGNDPGLRRLRQAPLLTFAELRAEYVAKHLQPNARSWSNIKSGLEHPKLAGIEQRRVANLTRRCIIDVIDSIVATGRVQAAINVLRYLKMMFNWAVSRDLVASSPCEGVKPPGKTTERDRVLTDAEISAVWNATYDLPAPFSAMYRMFFLTGQRRTEVATMQWNEVTGETWTIPREKVKKDRAHAVPLTPTALATLGELPRYAVDGFIFSTTGGERPSSNYQKSKARLDRLSGVTDWTIHDLRRTVRSKLAELRVPEVVARKVLNHETGKVDRIYNRHDYAAEKREALTLWEGRLKTILAQSRCPGGCPTKLS